MSVLDALRWDVLNPRHVVGALVWGVIFFSVASVVARLIRRFAARIQVHLSDTTGLGFFTALGQMLAYVVAFILYAHLVPELRAIGTAMLAGVGVASLVLGLAAQNTLGNLVAGVSIVLYRPVHLGDRVELTTPRGLEQATVRRVTLGHTVLEDVQGNEIIVPNGVMLNSVVLRLRPAGDAGTG